jgi:hypothetical protein
MQARASNLGLRKLKNSGFKPLTSFISGITVTVHLITLRLGITVTVHLITLRLYLLGRSVRA